MRKTFIIILTLALLGAGGILGYRSYKGLRQNRLISQARNFLAKSDPTNAVLCLQRAVRLNPYHLDTCRLMAEVAEAGRVPTALFWRNRIAELNPGSVDDRLALAQTALVMRDLITASNALEKVAEPSRNSARYQNVAGILASSSGRFADAETHFGQAVRLEPQNASMQMNLAVSQLRSTNVTRVAEARAALDRLRTNPATRPQALRELATDALRSKQTPRALALTKELLQNTNSVFGDRLLWLDALRAGQSAEFKLALVSIQKEAGVDPNRINTLAMWQMAGGGTGEALAWLQSLPRTTQTNMPVALLVAECQTTVGDWAGLNATLEKQNWGEVNYLRYAFRSLALRNLGMAAAAKGEWGNALKNANGASDRFIALFRLTARWKWQPEVEEILWSIVNGYPGERWAVATLNSVLIESGRTRSLLSLYKNLVATNPGDTASKNNLAMAGLLLDASEVRPHELAKEVYEKDPKNPYFATTYAFSLMQQGKAPDALKLLEQLNPKDLEHPSISGYYGLVLRASGDTAKAKKYLELAFTSKLMPEERQLMEKAKL